MRTAVVIPARYGSTRLPGKPLLKLKGKPLIQYTYEQAVRSPVDRVIVATDDERVLECVKSFGGEAVMTSLDHPSGTDRVAEVARGLDVEVIVNLQCDEPLIEPRHIGQLLPPFHEEEVEMATLIAPLTEDEWRDPNVVKAVVDRRGYALYFSRAPIPFSREGSGVKEGLHWRHVGIYAYRRDFLLRLSSLPPSPLEEEEKLEQLRALEHGFKIFTVLTDYRAPGVDTEEDLRRVLSLLP